MCSIWTSAGLSGSHSAAAGDGQVDQQRGGLARVHGHRHGVARDARRTQEVDRECRYGCRNDWATGVVYHGSARSKRSGENSTLPEVITRLEQVTPQWLTVVLSRSGALTRGAVASFELDEGCGNWSSNARLVVNYTAEAQGGRPQRLFLKMVDTDLGDDEFFGPSEVD